MLLLLLGDLVVPGRVAQQQLTALAAVVQPPLLPLLLPRQALWQPVRQQQQQLGAVRGSGNAASAVGTTRTIGMRPRWRVMG
jgi:hypothetical protein